MLTDSLAFTIADWTRKLPAPMRDETDRTEGQRFPDALRLACRWFQFCVMLDV